MASDTIPGFTPTALPGGTNQNSPTGKPLAPPGLAIYNPKTKTYELKPIGIQTGSGYVIPTGDSTHQTPEDYGPIKTTEFGTGVNTTAYTAADAWNVPQELVPSIKAGLVQAGLLPAKDFGTGAWDFNSAAAYQKVLEFANTYGLTATDALQYFVHNPVVTPGATVANRVIQYTNPQDIATGFQNVSQSLTGQEQNPSEFEQQYHAAEAAQGGPSNQSYTGAPSITGAATQYVQQNMPQQEQAYGVASRMQDFFSMIGSK